MAEVKVNNKMADFCIELEESEGRYTVTIDNYTGSSEEVVIPEFFCGIPVTTIGDYSFLHEEKIKKVVLPKGVISIGDSAFCGCTCLTDINFPESLISIGSNAFEKCISLTEINFPENLVSVDYSAFENCGRLKSITFSKKIADIGFDAFLSCTSLEQFTVDGQNPFYSSDRGVLFDRNMTTLIRYPTGRKGNYTIPDSIVNIEKCAFDGCIELTGISFPEYLMSTGITNFSDCEKLSNFIVNEKNLRFSSKNGVLFDKEGYKLIKYPQGRNDACYTVPDSVVQIGRNAFSNSKRLTGLILPQNLRYIDWYSFYGCEQLTEITLPVGLKYIGEYAFDNCPNLNTVTLSRNTKTGYRTYSDFSGQLVYLD